MNSVERVLAAFRQEPTDKIPVMHIGFTAEIASALLGREAYVGGGIQQWREATALWNGEDAHREFVERSFQDACDIGLLCEHDILRVNYWRYNVRPTRRIDEHTFLYEHGPEEHWKVLHYQPESEQCHITDYRPQGEVTLDQLERQIAVAERQAELYRPQEADFEFEIRAQRLYGHDHIIRANAVPLGIPAETAWLEATILRPDLIARFLDVQVAKAVRNVEFLSQYGLRTFFGGNDFAANEGPMYSPRFFREMMPLRLKRISDACHRCNCFHLFASDGNLWPVADDLFGRTGIDGYHEIDRRAGMDLAKLRRRFPGLTLVGNISSHTVHLGSREDVVAETRSCLAEAKHSDGIIVGVSNYFVPGTPVENVEAVLATIAEHRGQRNAGDTDGPVEKNR